MPDFYEGGAYGMSCKVLCISPKKIMVEEQKTELVMQLGNLVFDVISIPFRDVHQFWCGLQYSANNIHRDDQLKDYFSVEYN